MSDTLINEQVLERMFIAGASNLEMHKDWINELNVFPVPDGDTGTNMTLTILSAVKEVNALNEISIDSISKAISMGSLRGARGNSGVILSQLIRGFAKEIQGSSVIDNALIASACQKAVETAYKAVMKPKEGTILTVARGVADKAAELSQTCSDIETLLNQLIEHAEYVLSQTPDMLPVLKEAGVVDSGGQGLVQFLKGTLEGYLGKDVTMEKFSSHDSTTDIYAPVEDSNTEITFGYCTEFIVNLDRPMSDKEESKIKAFLDSIGDSIVCVNIDDILKIHVHTDEPGSVIQKGLSLGSLSRIKIDNMREEYEERQQNKKDNTTQPSQKDTVRKKYGFISVAAGEGFSDIFKNIGVDFIIEGGQTMNPSTEDMLSAIDMVNAEDIFILPNNSNIILAATQAQKLVEGKNIHVIPSKTLPQGIAAMIAYMPDSDAEDNYNAMVDALNNIKSGQITYAVRDTVINGREVHENDYIGIGDNIFTSGQSIHDTIIELTEGIIDNDKELISIYYGMDVKKEEAEKINSLLCKKFDNCDIELQYGGQPVYYYIISVE